MKTKTIEILGQNITVKLSRLGKFFTVEPTENIVIPEDIEGGKAAEEIFAAFKKALIDECWCSWRIGKRFFADPNNFFLSAIDKQFLPPEVAAYPENYWYDHTDEVWRKIN